MKNEVYWGLRGSSVFWLYNIQETRVSPSEMETAWPTPTTASVLCISWWGSAKGLDRSIEQELAFLWAAVSLCKAQLTVLLNLNSSHSSFGGLQQWVSHRKVCGLWGYLSAVSEREMVWAASGFRTKSHHNRLPPGPACLTMLRVGTLY